MRAPARAVQAIVRLSWWRNPVISGTGCRPFDNASGSSSQWEISVTGDGILRTSSRETSAGWGNLGAGVTCTETCSSNNFSTGRWFGRCLRGHDEHSVIPNGRVERGDPMRRLDCRMSSARLAYAEWPGRDRCQSERTRGFTFRCDLTEYTAWRHKESFVSWWRRT